MDAEKKLIEQLRQIDPAYRASGVREDGDKIRFSFYHGAGFRGCEVHVDDVTNDSAVRIALGLEPLTAEVTDETPATPLHPQEFIDGGKPVFKDGGVVQLSSMDLTARTKGELKAMAADLAIELPSGATKAEIIEILEAESAVVETPEAQAKAILDDYVPDPKILKFEEPTDGPVTKERKAAIRAERYPKGSKAFSDPDDSDGQA